MRTATIKTIILIAVFIALTIFPIGDTKSLKITLISSIILFFFGLFTTPLLKDSTFYDHSTIQKPKWSDKINEKNISSLIHFIGFLLLTAGVGGLLGGLLKGQIINYFGIIFFVIGLGILIGMYISTFKKIKNN